MAKLRQCELGTLNHIYPFVRRACQEEEEERDRDRDTSEDMKT